VNVADELSLSLFTGTDKALSQRKEGGKEKGQSFWSLLYNDLTLFLLRNQLTKIGPLRQADSTNKAPT